MRIENRTKPKNTVKSGSMTVGEVARIVRGGGLADHNGEVILRTYDGFVSLTNPAHTWTGSRAGTSFDVVLLDATLVVEETA